MEEKKKLSTLEREKLKLEKLQQEMLDSKKRIEEAKNKEVLKVWKKIKPLFIREEILNQLDQTFIETLALEIEEILKKYLPKEEKEVTKNE